MMEFRPSLTRKVVGWLFLFLGVLGLVLPFLQGFLFIALGLFTLRHQYLWAHRGMGWVERRWPGAISKVEGLEARMIERVRGFGAGLRLRTRRLMGRG